MLEVGREDYIKQAKETIKFFAIPSFTATAQ